jgi:hypothetical protein
MLTRLHKPGKGHPEEEPLRLCPEIVTAELGIVTAEGTVRLCILAEALASSPAETAQIVADSIRPGATFIESVDALLKEVGEA